MFDRMGTLVNRLGIERYLIDNGEGFMALHSFIRGNFLFVGYSNRGVDEVVDVPLPW